MSNNPFDRTIVHELEKPLADDINQLETNADHALRFFIAALFSDPATGTSLDGFLGTGLLVAAASPTNMSVSVTAGLGFQLQTSVETAIDSVPGLNDLEPYKPLPLSSNQGFTVPVAPVAPNSRIDIIEVRADRVTTDPSLRQVLDIGLGQFVPDTLDKTLAWALDGRASVVNAPSPSTAPLSYVVGQEANPGLAPPTSPGYIKIAEIAVGSGVTAISPADISDFRALLSQQIVKMHFPATTGFGPAAQSGVPEEHGSVAMALADTWSISIGNGLEAGDIIDDIVVIVEKVAGATCSWVTDLFIADVDLDAGLVTRINPSTGTLVVTSALGVLQEISHANAPGSFFPFEWKAGFGGTMRCTTVLNTSDRVYGAYAIVRRVINKRDR